MASIGEVYEAQARGMVDPQILRFGLGLFVVGVAVGFASLLLGTTELGGVVGLDTYAAREVAGVLAGVSVPTVLVGTLALFPASARAKAGAAIGAGIAALGVALFWYAYPQDWAGYGRDLTAYVSTVYAVGVVTIAWALFTTVATFKRRNDPGGTLEFHLSPSTGQPRLLEAARAGLRGASLSPTSWFGASTSGPQVAVEQAPAPPPANVTDGGDGEVLGASSGGPHPVDRYCGNCQFFTYGHDDQGRLSPYCQYHDEAMDDMEPCAHWDANAG
ncbi:MAG: hypothetical protein ACLFMX_07785 [Halobacteriales archaeon]